MGQTSLLLERVKDDIRQSTTPDMSHDDFDHTDNWSDSWADGGEHADSSG